MTDKKETELSFHEECDAIILEYGWMRLCTPPDEDDTSLPWCYTVGFTEIDLPEIIATANIPFDALDEMVGYIAKEQYRLNNVPEDLTELTPYEVNDEPARFSLVEIADPVNISNKYALQCEHRYGANSRYLQLLVSDKNNLLPGEDGYDTDFEQPLL